MLPAPAVELAVFSLQCSEAGLTARFFVFLPATRHRIGSRLTLAILHAIDGYMQKIQILFPNPLMGRVRAVATEEDRPVSEVIRRAVERFLEMRPEKSRPHWEIPTFRGGQILVSAERLKDVIYDDEHL